MNQPQTVGQIQPVRGPVASEVLHYASKLDARAQALAERVSEKLHSVMTSDTPRLALSSAKERETAEYPPLFAGLRSNFQSIDDALERIEYAILRTEL